MVKSWAAKSPVSPLKSQRSSAVIKKCLEWENWVDKCSSHPWWSEGWLETRHNISGYNTGNASVLAPSEVRHHLAVVLCDFKSLHGLQVLSFYSCASCRPTACCCGGASPGTDRCCEMYSFHFWTPWHKEFDPNQTALPLQTPGKWDLFLLMC